ncbi:MAG TPA: methyltransferase domain-containing protein [Candidatus Nanoarchaeia archaeon]|nr:methyltransferase domain-containing protein [Candidatus Nanoarchaeia archaeon]
MSNRVQNVFVATLSFVLATMLSAFMSALALGFVWARGKSAGAQIEGLKHRAFLADKQRTLSFYRVFSAAYDILNPHFYTDRMRTEIIGLIQGEDLRVLDVGCGTGYTSIGLLKSNGICEVVGLDMNPVQLGRASRNLHADKARVSLAEGDADNLPFEAGSFDAVISVGAIENFPNPQRTIEEMTRVTKHGGVVIVGGPEFTWFRKVALNRLLYSPSKAEVRSFFAKAGLKGEVFLTGLETAFETSRYVVVGFGRKE